jgi:hypothetical protein
MKVRENHLSQKHGKSQWPNIAIEINSFEIKFQTFPSILNDSDLRKF